MLVGERRCAATQCARKAHTLAWANRPAAHTPHHLQETQKLRGSYAEVPGSYAGVMQKLRGSYAEVRGTLRKKGREGGTPDVTRGGPPSKKNDPTCGGKYHPHLGENITLRNFWGEGGTFGG